MYEMIDAIQRKSMHSTKVKWISSYNFVCLLNIPDQVKEFGSVFHYWEGSGLGEKIVQVGKKHFHSFRKKWQTNLSKRIIKYNTLSLITSGSIETYECQDHGEVMNNQHNKSAVIHKYKCTATPFADF